jgi:hypothetical protein
MKISIRAALTAALLSATAGVALSPAPVAAQSKAAEPIRVSPEVAKKLNDANAKMGANDLDGALALIKEAQALPKLTPADDFQVHKFLGIVSVKKDDFATAEGAFDFMARSPVLPENEKASTLLTAAGIASENKHYDKVTEYVAMAEAAGIKDESLYVAAGNAAFMKNDSKSAAAYANKALEVAKAAGTPPKRNAYDLLLQAQLQGNDTAGSQATMEQLAINYGTPEDWGYAISGAIGTPGANDTTVTYLARLANVTGAKTVDADVKLFGEAANRGGFLGDAQKAQEKGATIANLAANVAKDKAALPKAEAEAAKAKDGNVSLALAQSFYGYGDFAKAEALARDAIAKGGIKAPNEANDAQMVLGQSLVAQGHYSDAIPVFAAVKSGNAAMNKAAFLWAGYAQQKLKQVSAPPAPAAR